MRLGYFILVYLTGSRTDDYQICAYFDCCQRHLSIGMQHVHFYAFD